MTLRTLLILSMTAMAALPAAVTAADAAAGAAAWTREQTQSDGSPARSCASCHGRDLTQAGRHVKTGKAIDPMAPSVNPRRLQDANKVEKWLLRNCRWTFGRACSATEKADFIAYLRAQ